MAKGFRVSVDSEEFQMVWPPSHKALTYDAERRLAVSSRWPRVLKALYSLSKQEISKLECALLSNSSATVVSASSTLDKFGRPMVVAACVTEQISWTNGDSLVANTVGRSIALSQYVSGQLEFLFTGNPRNVESELKTNGVDLNLSDFAGPSELLMENWRAVIHAAQEWQGVCGIASPPLLPLGGNVVLGTEHEAIRLAGTGGTAVDGFYDAKARRIIPITENLTKWPRAWRPYEPASHTERSSETLNRPEPSLKEDAERDETLSHNSLEAISRSLQGVETSFRTIAESFARLVDGALDVWFGGDGNKKSRK